MRHCLIVSASVENQHGVGDGAYDLLSESGDPETIGKAIADSLKETDLWNPSGGKAIEDRDEELYVNIRIKVANHPVEYDEEID